MTYGSSVSKATVDNISSYRDTQSDISRQTASERMFQSDHVKSVSLYTDWICLFVRIAQSTHVLGNAVVNDAVNRPVVSGFLTCHRVA
jgi:hypothetical protein